MKIAEIRELSVDELNAKVQDAHKQLFEARLKLTAHQLEDTAQLSRLRHQIAQFQTVLTEKRKQA